MKKINRSTALRWAIVLIFIVATIVTMVMINRPDPDAVATSASKLHYATARVTAVVSDNTEADYKNAEGRRVGLQELEILILNGDHAGETMSMTNYLSALANVDVGAGDRIIVQIVYNDNGTYYPTMHNYDRGIVMGFFLVAFIAVIILIGGKKGAKALLGLVYTLLCLWFILIPLVLKGYNSILTAVTIAIITAAVSFVFLDGFTRKTLTATLGCVGGLAVAGISAAIVGAITPLSGYNMGEAESLILQATYEDVTISGLLVCGILIAALGAVMDVAMSISSAIHEMDSITPGLPAQRIFKFGMDVGRDAMGTMANTLILVFFGSSLNTLLLVKAYEYPFLQLINTDYITIELLQGLSGTIGIVMTVPLVAAFSAWNITRSRKKMKKRVRKA